MPWKLTVNGVDHFLSDSDVPARPDFVPHERVPDRYRDDKENVGKSPEELLETWNAARRKTDERMRCSDAWAVFCDNLRQAKESPPPRKCAVITYVPESTKRTRDDEARETRTAKKSSAEAAVAAEA